MCESIPSVTLWGTTQLTSTITTSTVLTTQVSQSQRLITSQIVTREIVTSLIPQQTLYYPCSDSTASKPTSVVNTRVQPRPAATQSSDSEDGQEGSVDPNATGQFTGSLPTMTRAVSHTLSFTSPPIKDTPTPSPSRGDLSSSDVVSFPSASSSSAIGSSGSASGESSEGNSSSSSSSSSNGGAIAGAVVGGIFGLILLITLVMCCQKRRARRRRRGDSWTNENDLPPDSTHGGGGEVGNDYWERRFREIESANSSRAGIAPNGNGLGLNGMRDMSEKEKMDWDSQTSRKLRLTLNLGSKDLPSRPPSRLSMISSFFGGRMTPTPNIMASPYHQHNRTGSTPTLRSMGGYVGTGGGKHTTKGSGSRFSFNPFRRHNQKPSFGNGNNHYNPYQNQSQPNLGTGHNRSISSPWPQEDSKSFKSNTTGTRSGNRSAGYSNSNKSPGARPSLEEGFGNNVNRSASKSTTTTNAHEKKRRSQNTFGKKMPSFDLPLRNEDENNNNNIDHNEPIIIEKNDNANSWNYDTTHPIQAPPQAITVNTTNLNSNGPGSSVTSGSNFGNGASSATMNALREGRMIESPTEEEIEERRNMEWIRHSNILSDHGEGTETLDSTDEEKLRDLKLQLGIDDLNDDSSAPFQQPKPFLGFAQFNSTIGNTPPQLGAIGTYTSSSNNSHLSGISNITSLPPARGGHSSGISSIGGSGTGTGTGTSSFIPYVPPPRNGTYNSNSNHFSGISTITSGTLNGTGTGTGPGTGTYNSTTSISTNLPFIPPIRGGHGSLSGLSITPSTVLPRGYLSGLSSAHSFRSTNRTIRPGPGQRSPDSISIPSDIIISSGPGQSFTQSGLQRNNSQSTVSTYSTHPVSPNSYSTQPSFGVSRPNSQFSDLNTNTNPNRNTRTLTYYKAERGSIKPGQNPIQPSRRSSSIRLKRTASGRVLSVVRDSLPPPPVPLQNRKSAFADADEDYSLSFEQGSQAIPSLPPPPLPQLPLSLHLPLQVQSQNRKSAFADADEDCVEIQAQPELPPPPASRGEIENRNNQFSPTPTSFYMTTENITRRSLKNQRESKGKHVPKIRLSQRALTPSLWIDEELLARFAEVDNAISHSYDDDGSTVKPTPIKERNNHLRNLNEIPKDNSNNSNFLSTKSDQNTLVSRFSNSTQGSIPISRKNSVASNDTTKTTRSNGSSTVNDHTCSKSQVGSSSRLGVDSNLATKSNSRSSSFRSADDNRSAKSSDRRDPPEEPAPTSLTPKPRALTRKEKGKDKEIQPEPQRPTITTALTPTAKTTSTNTPKTTTTGESVLSPHTPPNKLPLFSPSFPKPPTPPLPIPSMISTWTQENSLDSKLNYRFSIKQRRKNHMNTIQTQTQTQGETGSESENGDITGNAIGNGKSVVTPQLPFLTLGNTESSANNSTTDLVSTTTSSHNWKPYTNTNTNLNDIQNKKKSAYEDADESENNQLMLNRI